jgi:Ca2+/Na+ antiporter
MITFINGVMVVLFILFMIFVFGGYHKNKSATREEQFRQEEEKQKELDKNNS